MVKAKNLLIIHRNVYRTGGMGMKIFNKNGKSKFTCSKSASVNTCSKILQKRANWRF